MIKMRKKEYMRAAIGQTEYEDNEHGTTVILSRAYESQEVDFSDRENVLDMVAYAIETANGIHELVNEKRNVNCIISEDGANTELFIALSALACEIYMKSLIYYSGKNYGKKIIEHRLGELFNILDESVQIKISNEVGIAKEEFDEIGKTFIELRYIFELNYIDKDYLVVFDFMEKLKDICSKLPVEKKPVLRATSSTARID